MDNLNESAPGEQPAATTTAAPTGEQPSMGSAPSPLDAIDSATLLAAMEASEYGTPENAEPAAPAAVTEAPAAQAEEEEIPAATTEQAPPADPNAPKGPQRLSVRSLPAEQQVELAAALDMVRRGEAPDIKTALGLTAPMPVQADPGQTQQQDPPATAAPASPAPASAKVAELKDSIAALREQRRAAKANFETDLEIELTEKIEDAQLQLLRAEQAEQVAAVEAISYNERLAATADAVEQEYPDLADENSVFSRILDDRITAAKARGDDTLKDPGFLRTFADQVAADLGITKGTTTASAAPAPAKPSRPVGSGLAPGNQTVARPTREQLVREIHDMPLEDLKALVCTE